MARYNIVNPLSDEGRNQLNSMFEELYSEYTEAGLNAKEAREKAVQAVADSVLAKDLAETTRQEMLEIIREQTRNGDLAPEIAQARGGKATIGERFNSIDSDLAQIDVDKADKTEVQAIDSKKMDKDTTAISVTQIDKNKGKLDQTYMTDEFLQQMAGDTPINAVPADESITEVKLAPKAVSNAKLSPTYASVRRIFTSDDLNNIKEEGIYYKASGSNPLNMPEGLINEGFFLEVRAWEHTSTVNKYLQKLTLDSNPFISYVRTFADDIPAGNFVLKKEIDKKTLTEVDVSNVLKQGYYLGLSTTGHTSIPSELQGVSFLLKVETYSDNGRFVLQTITQTSGQIENTFKRFIQVGTTDNVVYDWKKDNSLLPSTGGGEAYDQSLNTTDNVIFSSVKTNALEVAGTIPTGTLANPPTGLLSGDMWADTTDSVTHPIVRVMV